jgi:hypothetical protein
LGKIVQHWIGMKFLMFPKNSKSWIKFWYRRSDSW